MSILYEIKDSNLSDYTETFTLSNIENQEIPNSEVKFVRKNLSSKNNKDVNYIRFYNCNMSKIPKWTKNTFSNLSVIEINESNLSAILRQDLSPFKNLKIFDISNTKIESIPGDLFDDTKRIEWVRFAYNKKLEIIEPNLLDNCEHLKRIRFFENADFEILYSIFEESDKKSSLDEVKKAFAERFFTLSSEKLTEFVIKLDKPEEKLKKFIDRVSIPALKSKLYILHADTIVKNSKSGFLADLKNYTENKDTRNLKIIVNGYEFMVHKFLFEARCPKIVEVFKKNSNADTLRLTDVSEDIFIIILKFIYTDELPGGSESDYLGIFAAAANLKIEMLKNYASEIIQQNINMYDAVKIHQIAIKYSDYKLADKAFQEVKKKYPKAYFKAECLTNPELMARAIKAFLVREEEIAKAEVKYAKIVN